MKLRRVRRPWLPNRDGYVKTNFDEFYHSRLWKDTRRNFLLENPLCKHCEEEGIIKPAKVVDHIIPIRKGGHKTEHYNLQGLCVRHNAIKTAKDK